MSVGKADRIVAVISYYRGKSGLRRINCQLTTGRRKSTESATENIPPF